MPQHFDLFMNQLIGTEQNVTQLAGLRGDNYKGLYLGQNVSVFLFFWPSPPTSGFAKQLTSILSYPLQWNEYSTIHSLQIANRRP